MHKLLILSRFARDYRGLLDAAHLPDLTMTATDDVSAVAAEAASFDLAFGEPALLRQVLPSLTAVRWIQSTWAGVEPLLDPALRRDYTLTNARGVFGAQMSEYVFAYLLARERKIFEKRASQQEGRWDPEPPSRLRGKQLGLLGVGTIGADLARTAKHFGMRVKGYTRASEDSADVDEYFHGPLADVARRVRRRSRLSRLRDAGYHGDATDRGRPAAARAAAARRVRQPGARRRGGRTGARRGAAGRPAGGRGARRLRPGAAAARSRVLARCRTC